MRKFLPLLLAASSVMGQAEPVEVRRAEPAVPRAQPVVPATPVTADAVAPGEIRALPSAAMGDPVLAALEQANALYQQKMFQLAADKYREFLQLRPRGPDRQPALFRLGESLRSLQREPEAMTAYAELIKEFNSGDFVGPAAYRLGEMQFAARDNEAAAASFRLAAHHVRDPKLRLAAKFFEGRALDAANRRVEALSAYRDVAAQQGDNPYRERAMFDLAEADARSGLSEGAFRQYRQLAASATNAPVRVASAVKGGLLAIDLRDYPAARPLLEQAAADRAAGAWQAPAESGLLRLDYEEGKYQMVADRAAALLPGLPASAQPEVLLLAANARRQLGAQAEALDLYDRLVTGFPASAAAREAGFHRLVSLVAQRDGRAAEQIDRFLVAAADPDQRSRAKLLKAELLFEQRDYAAAEPLYAEAATASGAAKYRSDALYKLAWCRLQQQKYDLAVTALTSFIMQYPRHPQIASAYAQRALAQLENGQREEALADFGVVIDKFPGAPEREDAMIQSALLLGSLGRSAEMTAAFQRVLAEFPGTKSAAQAHFWTGYTAFEEKKYADAVAGLEKARELDPAKYGERATLRLLLSHYYAEDREAAAREATALGADKAPAEVRSWLGLTALEDGRHAEAVEMLAAVAGADDASDDLRLALAQAQIGAGQNGGARTTLEKFLARMHEPKTKARAHLLLSEALIGLKDLEGAKAQAEEALKLQPEGRLNAEARLANGRALFAQDRYDDAARAFMAVALLYDEKDLTPEALVLAEQAYRQADNMTDADRAREELQRRYPDFKTPASS
ncbi:MAG: tetratricopeptide repeat protein [Chthoniobacterales bacterium]